MAKPKKVVNDQLETAEDDFSAESKSRIGIMMGNFMQCISLGPQTHHRTIKPWSRGQVIFSQSDIDELLSLNAPIRTYIEE